MKSYLDDLIRDGCKEQTAAVFKNAVDGVAPDSLPYNQGLRRTVVAADGRTGHIRCDCSGWATFCMNAALDGPGLWGGYSTATFATYGVIFPIPLSLAEIGDYLGVCGPNTDASGGGGGHIAPIVGRTGSTFVVFDHGGGSLGDGPNRRNAPTSAAWAKFAWRYAFKTGATPPIIGAGIDTVRVGAFGGVVRDIQRAVGATIDGDYGTITEGLVREWQRAHGLVADGVCGPLTQTEMAKLYDETLPPPDPTPPPVTDYVTKEQLAAALKAQQQYTNTHVDEELTAAFNRLSVIIAEAWPQ